MHGAHRVVVPQAGGGGGGGGGDEVQALLVGGKCMREACLPAAVPAVNLVPAGWLEG